MSLVPERWGMIARGLEDGVPYVIVAREKEQASNRLTAWRLVKYKGDWRVKEILFSKVNLGLDRIPNKLKPYKTPVRLSDSAIDNHLRWLAEYGSQTL